MPLFIFFMSLLLAEIISDEYRNGTLKLFLLHPVDRTVLLNAKITAMIVSVLMQLLFVMVGSYIIGTAFWGWGDQMNLYQSIIDNPQSIKLIIGLFNIAVYTIIFYVGSVVAFKKKDILA